jgi:hypothetical protein
MAMNDDVLHDLKQIATLSRALTFALDKLFEDVQTGSGKGFPTVHMRDLIKDFPLTMQKDGDILDP